MIRLSKSQILLIHDQLIAETGGSSELLDEGLLDSALNAPFQTFGEEDVYPSLQQKAARLCFGLVKKSSFCGWKQANRRTRHASVFGAQWRRITAFSDRAFRCDPPACYWRDRSTGIASLDSFTSDLKVTPLWQKR